MSNHTLKPLFFSVTRTSVIGGDWGRGQTIQEAKKNANYKRGQQGTITIVNFKNNIPDEVFKQLEICFVVNQAYGSIQLAYDCTEDDISKVNEYFVGYTQFDF